MAAFTVTLASWVFVEEPIENWGNYVYARINSVELLEREIKKYHSISPKILLSSATDPYQNCEKQYKLTQGILGVLGEHSYGGLVSILTKSPLVTRDIKLISNLKRCEVGITITETNDKICKTLELRAPTATSRINTLRKLNDAGIETYAFIGPLLPHLRNSPRALDKLFKSISESDTNSVYIEHMNLKKYIINKINDGLEENNKGYKNIYIKAKLKEHKRVLSEMINPLLNKYGLHLRLGHIIVQTN